jgi:hypothetical protein
VLRAHSVRPSPYGPAQQLPSCLHLSHGGFLMVVSDSEWFDEFESVKVDLRVDGDMPHRVG